MAENVSYLVWWWWRSLGPWVQSFCGGVAIAVHRLRDSLDTRAPDQDGHQDDQDGHQDDQDGHQDDQDDQDD